MRIDIWSDVICPWCFLGSRRLHRAIEMVGEQGIEVHWHAYQLHPDAGPEPVPLAPVIDTAHGEGAFASMSRRLGALGSEVGIDFRFDRASALNTFDAHRLIASTATDPSMQRALVEQLFHSYFTDGRDVSSREVLVELAAEAGLDAVRTSEVLAGDEFAPEVEADRGAALELGISGVPAFVFEREFLVPGAQDTDRLAQLIERLRQRSG